MAEKAKSINLLPHKGDGFLDQFLGWALTIGRLLIILTETLALGTFLYRFSLDMKIADLHDKIKNERAIVEQFKTTEDTARNLQARLSLAQQYDTASGIAPNTLSDIVDMGRGQVTFKDILVETNGITIDIQATNSNALSLFVNHLKSHPRIKSVNINKVENKTTTALIKMNITVDLKTPNK